MQSKSKYFFNLFLGTAIIMAIFYICSFALNFLGIKFPASLTAMLALFLLLTFKIIPLRFVEDACNFFLKYMVFFFVPLLVMLPDNYEVFKEDIWTITIALVISALLTLATTSLIVEKLHNKRTMKGSGNAE